MGRRNIRFLVGVGAAILIWPLVILVTAEPRGSMEASMVAFVGFGPVGFVYAMSFLGAWLVAEKSYMAGMAVAFLLPSLVAGGVIFLNEGYDRRVYEAVASLIPGAFMGIFIGFWPFYREDGDA